MPWVLGDSFWKLALLEKVVLVAMVSIVFAHVLPDVRATEVQLTVAVALIVTMYERYRSIAAGSSRLPAPASRAAVD